MRTDNDVYRSVIFDSYPLPDDQILLHNLEDHQLIPCSVTVRELLSLCRGARPLTQHLEAIQSSGVLTNAASAPQLLTALVDTGLLQKATSPSDAHPHGAHSRLSTIAIVTADRPAALHRCLSSAAAHFAQHSLPCRFLVVDGSRDQANASANRQAVAHVSSRHVEARLVDSRASGEYYRAIGLSPTDPTLHGVLSLGLAGAGRTLALLLCAGDDVLFLDDDVVVAPWQLDGADTALEVIGHAEQREVSFYDSRRAATHALPAAAAGLLGAHDVVLGRPLRSLQARYPLNLSLQNACGHLTSAASQGSRMTVRVTFSGIAGDSALYCPARQLFSSGSWRAALWSSPDAFTTAMTSREGRRIASRYLLTHDPHCMAYCMGVANREMVPPFLSNGWNEDGVFGALFTTCWPDALFAHVPVGVVHDSHRPSRYEGPSARSARGTRLSDLIIATLLRLSPSLAADDPSVRIRRIGAFLEDLGSLDVREFRRMATRMLLTLRERDLAVLRSDLATVGVPAFWSAAQKEYLSTLLEEIQRPTFFVPLEFGAVAADDGYRAARQAVGAFGRLLTIWPDLWHCASRHRLGA